MLGYLAYVLTFSRLLFAAGFAVLAARAGDGPLGGVATMLLLVAAIMAELTDAFDGWAARKAGTASEFGGLIDPLCDSLGRLTMYFAAALAGWVTIAVPLVMAGRDIVVAYVRVAVGRYGGRTGARLSGKLKAIIQGGAVVLLVLLASCWLRPGDDTPAWIGAARGATAAAVIGVTAWSLVDYIRGGWGAILRLAHAKT